MWGFIGLFIGTALIFLEYDLFRQLLGQKHGFLSGGFFLGFEFVLDTLGLLFLIGLTLALVRRFVIKRPPLQTAPVDLILPGWLILIGLTGFVVEGLRLAAGDPGYSPAASPVGFMFSLPWSGLEPEAVRTWHTAFWWLHLILALGWIACLPLAPKAIHTLAAMVNPALDHLGSRGRPARLDVEAAFENDSVLGFEKITDLTRKDLLDLTTCTECGRCEMNCPAHIAGKTLSPRRVILSLRGEMNRKISGAGTVAENGVIIEGLVGPDEIGACTTCLACVEACPVHIDPLAKIIELRRYQVMIRDEYPEIYAEVFAGTDKRGNPWNEHPTSRMDWARGLDVPVMSDLTEKGQGVEYLFWVGCSASFDPRNQKIARSMVRILEAAGVSYAVLGQEEKCTGDPVRRMGHEYLFQIRAEENVETISRHDFSRILTICPHCFNTLKNEYPDFGGNWDVVHHTRVIRDLIENNRLCLTRPVDAVAVYHDSCYLGRYNRVFDDPRRILEALPGLRLVEMERQREFAMCCGAGGGLTWIEEDQDHRVNDLRIGQAREALASAAGRGSQILATACPFCLTMLEDGLSAVESELVDKDVAELVAEALSPEN